MQEWLEPFWHSSHVICMAVPERLKPFWHSSSASGITCMQEWLEPFWHCQPYLSAIMTCAILARPYMQYLSARMARAILALKSCNLHGCARKARAILALKFGQWHHLHARMARAILALKSCNLHGCARMARAILALLTIFEYHNGLSHSGTQVMQLTVSEWLEPF